MCLRSVGSAMAEAPRRRFRLRDLSPRWCRAKACPRLIFPEPVRLNRFAAARFVFIFGIFAPLGYRRRLFRRARGGVLLRQAGGRWLLHRAARRWLLRRAGGG